MLLCLSCMLLLTACTQTVAVPTEQHCPQIPPLLKELKQPVNVDNLDRAKALAEYVLKLSAKCDEIAVERNELSKPVSKLNGVSMGITQAYTLGFCCCSLGFSYHKLRYD